MPRVVNEWDQFERVDKKSLRPKASEWDQFERVDSEKLQSFSFPSAPEPRVSDTARVSDGSMLGSFGSGVLSGATSGFSDELAGLLSSALGGDYEKTVSGMREREDVLSRANPWTHFGGKMLGSLITAGQGGNIMKLLSSLGSGGTKVGQAVLPFIGSTASKAPSFLDYLKVGAASGALSSIGESEGSFTERLMPGAFGAAFGAATTPIAAGLGKGIGAASSAIGRKLSESKDLSNLRSYFPEEGIEGTIKGLEDVVSQPSRRDISETLSISVLDKNPTLRRQLFRQAENDQGMLNFLAESYGKRAEGFKDRIYKGISNILRPKVNIPSTIESVKAERGERTSGLFREAISDVPIPERLYSKIDSLMRRPTIQKAFKEAKDKLKDYDIRLESFSSDKFSNIPSRMTMDVLDEMRNVLKGLYVKASTDKDRALYTDLRKQITSIMDEASPRYREARGVYEGYSENIDALRAGQNAFAKIASPDEALQKIKPFEKSEINDEYVKSGFASAFRDKLEDSSDILGDINKLLQKSSFREKVKTLFGEKSLSDLEQLAKKEKSLYDQISELPESVLNISPETFRGFRLQGSLTGWAIEGARGAGRAFEKTFGSLKKGKLSKRQVDMLKYLTGEDQQRVADEIIKMLRRRSGERELERRLIGSLVPTASKSGLDFFRDRSQR